MKVVISQTVALNGGDAAILFGLLRTLREAYGEVEVTIFDNQPEIAGRLYPELTFERLLWHHATTKAGRVAMVKAAELLAAGRDTLARALVGRETFRALKVYAEADLLIWTGGTYLVEHYDLEPRFFDKDVAQCFDKPLILFTQSAGPFQSPRNRRQIEELGRLAIRIFARDERTFGNFLEAGVDGSKMRVVGDAGFAIEPPSRPEPSAASRPRIAVSVRHWPHGDDAEEVFERYVESHRLAIERAVTEREAHVTFLSTCQGVSEYWANDSDVAKTIQERLAAEVRRHVVVDDKFHRPREIAEAYAATDLVVATRMHAAILALLAQTAVFPVAYEFKTRELFRRFGQTTHVQPLEQIEPGTFGDRLLEAIDDRERLREEQQAGVASLRSSALGVAEELLTLEVSP